MDIKYIDVNTLLFPVLNSYVGKVRRKNRVIFTLIMDVTWTTPTHCTLFANLCKKYCYTSFVFKFYFLLHKIWFQRIIYLRRLFGHFMISFWDKQISNGSSLCNGDVLQMTYYSYRTSTYLLSSKTELHEKPTALSMS